MRISDNEVKKILSGQYAVVEELIGLERDIQKREKDADLITQVTEEVIVMPDREEMIAELKRKIEAGEYNPSGEDIADAMIRRSIADRIGG
jgi:negative regulator of flagellin synthesis FlgM